MTSAPLTLKEREDAYIPIVVPRFLCVGLSAAFACALVRQESEWMADIHVGTGPDGARGGAWGLFQMTLKTAQSLGDKELTGERLLLPSINAAFAADLTLRNRHALPLSLRREPSVYRELAAMHNSGRPYDLAPDRTRNTYVPRVLTFMAAYVRDPRVPQPLTRLLDV